MVEERQLPQHVSIVHLSVSRIILQSRHVFSSSLYCIVFVFVFYSGLSLFLRLKPARYTGVKIVRKKEGTEKKPERPRH